VNPLPKLTQNLIAASVNIKILMFFGMWLAFWLPIAVPLAIWLDWKPSQPITLKQKLPLVLSLYALVPLLLWGFARFGGIAIADLGWHLTNSTLITLALGLLVGVVGVWLTYALQWRLGWVNWNSDWRSQATPTILPALALGLVIGAIEESVFRGFLLSQLQLELPFLLAALVSSFIFAIAHLLWDGWAGTAQLPGLGLMGIVLAIAVAATKGSLGLAAGLHAGWIWTLAVLDGAELTKLTGQAPTWVTGKDGQVLTGISGALLLTLTGVGLLIYWLTTA
jgi:hypothetical protein